MASLTRKHFIQFAEQVKTLNDQGLKEQAKVLADSLIELSLNENPRFNTQRFLKACGL